jgi:hypothetical protein
MYVVRLRSIDGTLHFEAFTSFVPTKSGIAVARSGGQKRP